MIRAKPWSGKDLKGDWEFTIKIDGVRALYTFKGGWRSRADKPLYNMPKVLPPGLSATLADCEVYCGGFKETIERVRQKSSTRPITGESLYSLDPLDRRLKLGSYIDPTAKFIKTEMKKVVTQGYEGLVLRQGDVWLKVKPEETYDVPMESFIEGTGKHEGRLGAVMTPKGKVGTGFSDADRAMIWADRKNFKGTTIEVSCMKLTEAGKFRHPRFVRIRYDK